MDVPYILHKGGFATPLNLLVQETTAEIANNILLTQHGYTWPFSHGYIFLRKKSTLREDYWDACLRAILHISGKKTNREYSNYTSPLNNRY